MSRRRRKSSPRSRRPDAASPVSRRRLWLFRVSALVLGPLLVFLLLELALRLAGFGYPVSFFLSTEDAGKAILVQNDRVTWRFFGPRLARKPFPVALAEAKAPDTVRIFVFGESAAAGDPQQGFGLSRMLQAQLSARYPGTRFEVVNAAITAINSHAILPIARDCVRQHGDVWVIYMGNNEVVGPYGSGTIFGARTPPLALIRASLAFKTTRTGQWLDQFRQRFAEPAAASKEWEGMPMFVHNQVRQDEPGMPIVYHHFQRNLIDILRAGQRSGARIIVSTMVSNLKDCAPFGSLHRAGLPARALAEWENLYRQGVSAQESGRVEAAIDAFQQAAHVDDTYAELHFRWGQCCLARGNEAEARRQFTLARDLDTLRFRADTQINEIIRHTAAGRDAEGIRFVDAEEALAAQSPHGLAGREFLLEHVHLNFEGNCRLARLIAEQVAAALPEKVAGRGSADQPWPAETEVAQRLAWTGWNEYLTASLLFARWQEPPFTMQFNHAEGAARLRAELDRLQPAIQPPALREAASAYRAALALSPDDWVLHQNLALLLQETGDLAGAAESWRRATQLLPHEAPLHVAYAVCLDSLGRRDEARTQFVEALRLNPDLADAHFQLGLAMGRQGDGTGALNEFAAAVRLAPDWQEARLNLGVALANQQRTTEAVSQFEEVLRRNPTNAIALKYLGELQPGRKAE